MSYLPDGNSPLEDYDIFLDVSFIVTDLDGTLIDGDEPVLWQIKKLISKLKKQHTQITVATGRTYYGAEARMQELGIDVGMPVALYNGGVVRVWNRKYIICKLCPWKSGMGFGEYCRSGKNQYIYILSYTLFAT